MRFEVGRYSRGYLPHFEAGAHPQFLTWRLADAVPLSAIETWAAELAHLPESERAKQLTRQIEAYADQGAGECLLINPCLARTVQEVLLFDHGRRYALLAWCVMPNHVHVLLTPQSGVPLGEILQALKGVSAKRLNKELGRSGQIWQRDYYDRMIRDERDLHGVHRYIEWNPVKAGLVRDPALYPWSSASHTLA